MLFVGGAVAEELEEVVAIEQERSGEATLARLEPTDGDALLRFFYRLSPLSLYRRFHSPITRPEQTHPEFLLNVDHRDREAVVAVQDGEIVGVARYVRPRSGGPAEVAVVVADGWHRQGIATRLMSALSDCARDAGIERFAFTMQADNLPVQRLVRRVYPDLRMTHSSGILEATVAVGASRPDPA